MADPYVHAKEVLPEVGYQEPKIKDERCGTCTHGETTSGGDVDFVDTANATKQEHIDGIVFMILHSTLFFPPRE